MANRTEQRALVHYCCMAPDHWERRGGDTDVLTIWDRKWAYCPWNARAGDGHDWMETGGVAHDVLASLRAAPSRES